MSLTIVDELEEQIAKLRGELRALHKAFVSLCDKRRKLIYGKMSKLSQKKGKAQKILLKAIDEWESEEDIALKGKEIEYINADLNRAQKDHNDLWDKMKEKGGFFAIKKHKPNTT